MQLFSLQHACDLDQIYASFFGIFELFSSNVDSVYVKIGLTNMRRAIVKQFTCVLDKQL